MKPCIIDDCDRPSRARGMCRAHYQRDRRTRGLDANQPTKKRVKKPTCQHLDCRRSATVRFTLPHPITRQEIACRTHAETLLGSFLPGVTVEDV